MDQLGLADPRHPGAGVLEAEHQPAAQLALAADQLLLGDAVRGDPGQLGAHHGEHLVELVGQAADRHPDQAGVGVVAGEGEHRVGQAAALADLLEQPRRRPSAERGVEHAEGEAAVVVAVHALHAEHQVDLLERAGRLDHARVHAHPAAAGRGGTGGSSPCSQPRRPKAGAHHPDHLGVVEVAGGGDDHVGGPVVALVEPRHLGPGQRLDRVDGAGDRAAERGLGAVGLLGEQVVHHVVGVVVVHRDLVEDHVALGLDVLGGEQRGGDHVAEHVDRQAEVLVEDPRVEAGVLLGGERVELAADRVERDRDVERGPLAGALEQQVLEEVRAAVQGRRLVARADADPDPDAGRPDAGQLLGDDAQPAGQDGTPDPRGDLRRRRRSPSAGSAWCRPSGSRGTRAETALRMTGRADSTG